MLKVTDLTIKSEKGEKDYQLTVSAGPRDKIITTVVFATISLMIWLSLAKEYLGMALICQALILLYCYDILEETVNVKIANGVVNCTRKKLGRTIGLMTLPVTEISGHEMTSKDLGMGGAKAQRLELKLANGSCYPLSKAFVLNEDVLKQLERAGDEIDDFISSADGYDLDECW